MKALTLWRPWPWAFLYAEPPKRVENRSWRPLLKSGEWIALHAGQRFDRDAVEWMREQGQLAPSDGEEPYPVGGLVALARYVRTVPPAALCGDRWAFGPRCWIFDRVVAVPDAPVVRGRQGLWTVGAEVLEHLRAQWPLVAGGER